MSCFVGEIDACAEVVVCGLTQEEEGWLEGEVVDLALVE